MGTCGDADPAAGTRERLDLRAVTQQSRVDIPGPPLWIEDGGHEDATSAADKAL